MNVNIDELLGQACCDLTLALGLLRALTLLPLHDPALGEVERLLTRANDTVREARAAATTAETEVLA